MIPAVDLAGDARPRNLWPQDTGTLPAPARDLLVRLIKDPYVTGATQPELWTSLITFRQEITSRLHDLYLELVIDVDQQLAIVRNVSEELLPGRPHLLRANTANHLATMLLLWLRTVQLSAQAAGEKAYVSKTEIFAQLEPYATAMMHGVTDEVKLAGRINSAIDAVKQLKLLTEETPDTYTIAPVLQLVVTAEYAAQLEAAYAALTADPEAADA